MSKPTGTFSILAVLSGVLLLAGPAVAGAQGGRGTPPPANQGAMDPSMIMADQDMGGPVDSIGMLHMLHSPMRRATKSDSARAMNIVQTLRTAIAKYGDTTTAVADGFAMFAPGLKNQPVYHFTSAVNGLLAAVQFDPARPTSLLYKKMPTGAMKLVGAMYTMPRTAPLSALDARVPLGIAEWHQHVNWCEPKATDSQARWLETRNGHPVFGPEKPRLRPKRRATRSAAVSSRPSLGGWSTSMCSSAMTWQRSMEKSTGDRSPCA